MLSLERTKKSFAIIAAYVDDLNFIETLEDLNVPTYLKEEFGMKDLSKTKLS